MKFLRSFTLRGQTTLANALPDGILDDLKYSNLYELSAHDIESLVAMFSVNSAHVMSENNLIQITD